MGILQGSGINSGTRPCLEEETQQENRKFQNLPACYSCGATRHPPPGNVSTLRSAQFILVGTYFSFLFTVVSYEMPDCAIRPA